MDAEIIADGFNALQWENNLKIDKKKFSLENCAKNPDHISRFKLTKVDWFGNN